MHNLFMHDDLMLSIGEVSKITEVSIRMLRHYDKIGIVKPAYIDPDNKYRYYKSEQIIFINYIKELRERGFSLKEIGRFFNLPDFNLIKDTFLSQIRKLDFQINKLQKTKNRIIDFLEQFDFISNITKKIDIHNKLVQLKQLSERKVFFIREKTLFSVKNFLAKFADLQNMIFKNSLLTKGFYMAIFYDDFSNLTLDKSIADIEFCVEIDETDINKSLIQNIRIIPEGQYASIIYDDMNNIENTKKAYIDLCKSIKENNFMINGPMIKKYLHRSIYRDGRIKAISELEILIKK